MPKLEANYTAPNMTIGIIGAGASGLYTAWMLDYLGISYEILEASDRIGGRVYTYNFPADNNTKHNYYDVGAMRYPNITATQPVFAALEALSVPISSYYISNPTAPILYNSQPWTAQTFASQYQPLANAMQPFLAALEDNFEATFETIVNSLDQYSVRDYLSMNRSLSFEEIQTLETLETGTGDFDMALTEQIMESLTFTQDTKWYRIEGGSSNLVYAMAGQLATQPLLNSLKNRAGRPLPSRQYDAILCGTTLGALRMIDLPGLGSPLQNTAMRSLGMEAAIKIAVKWASAWWINVAGMTPTGGVGKTDLPIRVVAFPPWTDEDDLDKPVVLIVSYAWFRDATRLGGIIENSPLPPQGSWCQTEIVDLVIRNLVALFQHPNITYEFLQSQFMDHHEYAWQNDPYSLGPYAKFGPGQFKSLYPALMAPLDGSDGKVLLMGEAASAHHGWISGAFHSAATSLYTLLLGEGLEQAAAKLRASPIFGGSFDELPDEMDEDVVYWMAQMAKKTTKKS